MAEQRVVALLGVGIVPPDTPILRADDLGVLRGDGVFETVHVRGGRPWLLDEHLARMARSAARLDIPLPPTSSLVDLAGQACTGWPADAEGALRLVCTRGSEDHGPATVFATLAAVSEVTLRARQAGVAVATATLGIAASARATAPWLLGGAKTLSYAVNMASQRWAQSVGADDVLWLSSDGYALEAPTSTLVWRDGYRLATVPAEATGILPGTTARFLLDHAGALGLSAVERMITPAELSTVDGAWLLSSVRGIAEIRSLDGNPLPLSPDTERLRGVLGYL
ncbi:MAG TPA: aminotransferase class IV [Micromonosporaceae bacterium]|nr:aminotransferase class IV [Micromonosporaceae bacterium]